MDDDERFDKAMKILMGEDYKKRAKIWKSKTPIDPSK